MWFLIIVALVLIGLAIEYPWLWAVIAGLVALFIWGIIWSNKAEKAEKEREKREDEQRWERIARENAAKKRAEEQRLAQLRQRFSNNPIVRNGVPPIAIQCARDMMQKRQTNPYQRDTFYISVYADYIVIADNRIYFAQYGLNSLPTDDRLALVQATVSAFTQAMSNEFSKYNIRCRYNSGNIINDYCNITFEIGFENSRSW